MRPIARSSSACKDCTPRETLVTPAARNERASSAVNDSGFASQVNSKWAQGDQAGALASAQKAKTWSIVGIVVGAVGGILYGLLVGMGAASGSWSSYGG